MTQDDIHCNLDPAVEAQGVKDILAALTATEKAALADDDMPLRHFRAEKGKTDKAIKQIKETLAWREEFQVVTLRDCFASDDDKEEEEENRDGDVSPTTSERLSSADFRKIMLTEAAPGKIYVRGYDKEGRAVVYMQPARENTNHELNNMRHLVWNMEKAIAVTTRQGFSKIVFVIDYTGWKLRDAPPLSTSRYTLDIMQKHYPERCYRFYLTNTPFVFRAFWSVVRPFVDPHTKEKIVFSSGAKGMEALLENLGGDASRLEHCVGGTHTHEFDVNTYCNELPFGTAIDDDTLFADRVVKK